MSERRKVNKINKDKNPEPFLRWAGGKRWLIKYLNQIIGDLDYQVYHEPFLGSGAIFFTLSPSNGAFLSDLNQELIDTYIAIKTNPNAIIKEMKNYKNTKEFYYEIRNSTEQDIISKASRFIYLNQTSFNGIYRVNQKGEYNVPYGYRTKSFLEEEKLVKVSEILQKVSITCGDFMIAKPNINERDLVFLDPPYTVSHNNNGFIKYNQKLFSLDDQRRLSKFIDYIREQKAYYILTNAAHRTILDIFEKGDRLIELNRASLVGGDNAKRGLVKEYIFTNIPGGGK